MRGTYKYYLDGELVAVSHNIITTEGKKHIVKRLASDANAVAGSIALGIGSAAAVVGDTALQFEAVRGDVILASPDLVNLAVVYKARFDESLAMVVREVGLLSSSGTDTMPIIALAETSVETWAGGASYSTDPYIGASAYQLTPAASTTSTATLSGIDMNLSVLKNIDKVVLGWRNLNGNTATVAVSLKTDAGNHYTYTTSAGVSTTGFNTLRVPLSSFTKTGNPDLEHITSVTVSVTASAGGAASFVIEGIKTELAAVVDSGSVLVTRSVLGAPITKLAGVPFEVEYVLDVTI